MKIKKIVALLLTLALLAAGLAALGGCQNSPTGPLRILVDLGLWQFDGQDQMVMEAFLRTVKEYGGPEDIEVEYVPLNTDERNILLTRIRTEVMAGGGPDVFIMNTGGSWYDHLFHFPEKNLENGLFLNLDKYIKNAQFMDWDRLTPAVMDVGVSERWGRGILPMTYTFPVTVFRAEELEYTPTSGTTWSDMLADETGVLQAAVGVPTMGAEGYDRLDDSFGDLADYKASQLTFTEEELLARVNEILTLSEKAKNGGFAHLPTYFQADMRGNIEQLNNNPPPLEGLPTIRDFDKAGTATPVEIDPRSDALTFVPIYNDDGGISVNVNAFAAVSANTKRPKDAFFVVDLLLSREVQANSALYSILTEQGVPTHEGLMTKQAPITCGGSLTSAKVAYIPGASWYMCDETYASFDTLRSQITHVRIGSSIDSQLDTLIFDCAEGRYGDDGPDVEKYVGEVYRTLRQMIGE